MEMFLFLTLLLLSEKDAQVKDALELVLKFYRENRELLLSLCSGKLPPLFSTVSSPSAPEEPVPPKKDAPLKEETAQDEAPKKENDLRLIEEFLKRQKLL